MTDLHIVSSASNQIVARKPAPKSMDIVVNDAEEMSLEIAQRLLKLNVDAHELEIIRTNALQKDVAYSSLNADDRRVIDYMCRSLKVEEIERDGRIWRTSYDFFRKLFPDPKTHEEIRLILTSLAERRFRIRNAKTGTVETFSWLNEVTFGEKGTIEIEITARVAEYHRIPTRAEISAYGGYTQYYLTASLGLLLQHQNFFHHILGRRVEWGLKHGNLRLSETPVEITVEEMRHLWGLSPDTKPHDLERYWLLDACERMSVATQVRISHYEPLRSPTRGRPVYGYKLYLTEVAKVDFLKRFEHFLELARANRSAYPKQVELPLNGADDRAERLTTIKAKLRALGAYRGQLQEVDSLTVAELSWVEGQLAIWDWAGATIVNQYKHEEGKDLKPIALLWRSIKHRLALQSEYPKAFLAIEREKKRAQVKTNPEPEPQETEDRGAIAQQLAQWFSSLTEDQQKAFTENALREIPQPSLAQFYRNGFRKLFYNGLPSGTLVVFKELAEKHGYQNQATMPE
jgi:hypothetical protein